jgi:hypothetical protein
VQVTRRDPEARPQSEEMKLVWNQRSPTVLQNAVRDFQNYLDKSMGIRVEAEGRPSLWTWKNGPSIGTNRLQQQ